MSERDYLIAKAERATDDRYRRGETVIVRRGGELKARATDPGYYAGIAGAGGGLYMAHRGAKKIRAVDTMRALQGKPSLKLMKSPGAKRFIGGSALAVGSSLAGGASMHRAGNRWREKQGLPKRSYMGGFQVER